MSDEELNGFTITERRMLLLLADGKSHSRDQLKECVDDELSSWKAMQMHLSRIRRKLRSVGQNVICEIADGRVYYRHLRP